MSGSAFTLARDRAIGLDGPTLRQAIRRGEWTEHTSGLAAGYVHANVVMVPWAYAFDFMRFCQCNPRACPLLEVTDVGDPLVHRVARLGDLRTDVPRYRVYEHGRLVDEPTDVTAYWRDDLVGFLLGCSGTVESVLRDRGVPIRFAEQGTAPPAFATDIACVPAGPFRGTMVVSMRPLSPGQAIRAVQITSRFPLSHGAPIHLGDPAAIGITNLERPDYGEPCAIEAGELPVFWPCGITPEAAASQAQLDLMITHKGGHMFIGDLRSEDIAVI